MTQRGCEISSNCHPLSFGGTKLGSLNAPTQRHRSVVESCSLFFQIEELGSSLPSAKVHTTLSKYSSLPRPVFFSFLDRRYVSPFYIEDIIFLCSKLNKRMEKMTKLLILRSIHVGLNQQEEK